MERNEKKSNIGVIVLIVSIIIAIGILVALFATGVISFKSNEIKEEASDNVLVNSDVDVDISIGDVTVSKDAPNAKIFIDGQISLTYDNNKYSGVTISGYCLGVDGEKYLMHGPGDGGSLYHNVSEGTLSLSEDIPQEVEYTDGTTKEWSGINWDAVKIKYCKIDHLSAIPNEGTMTVDSVLSFEKSFE